jgi:SAM-dependent methyltransferase
LSYYPPFYSFKLPISGSGPLGRFLGTLEYYSFYHFYYTGQARLVYRGVGNNETGNRHLLDIGCGNGLLLLCLRRYGFVVQGQDFQPEAVDYVRNHLDIPAACGEMAHLARLFAPESFHVITAFHVLEHLVDVQAVLESCFSLLKPGGWFVGATPLVDSFQAALFRSRWLAVTEAPRHVTLPSQAGLYKACERGGFTGMRIKPDSLFSCAAVFALSLLPGGTTARVYGVRRLSRFASRLLAGALALVALPWCALENYVLRRPAAGIVFARKPITP